MKVFLLLVTVIYQCYEDSTVLCDVERQSKFYYQMILFSYLQTAVSKITVSDIQTAPVIYYENLTQTAQGELLIFISLLAR